MKLINRPQYTDKIRPSIGKGLIIVLTGQRRVGKGCILQQLIKDNYPKYVISLAPFHKVNNREGITQLHLREFLKRDF